MTYRILTSMSSLVALVLFTSTQAMDDLRDRQPRSFQRPRRVARCGEAQKTRNIINICGTRRTPATGAAAVAGRSHGLLDRSAMG
jgi:hypothetical protein